jgi:hypothetical protein
MQRTLLRRVELANPDGNVGLPRRDTRHTILPPPRAAKPIARCVSFSGDESFSGWHWPQNRRAGRAQGAGGIASEPGLVFRMHYPNAK